MCAKGSKVQFCKKANHDTFITGRDRTNGCIACKQDWAKNHKELISVYHKEKYKNKKEEILERTNKYNNEHKEDVYARIRIYSSNHLEERRLYSLKCTTNRNLRIVRWDQIGIKEFYANCPKGMVIDHIIPLQGKLVSGLHVLSNLQYLTVEENSSKHNQFDGTLENISWRNKILSII